MADTALPTTLEQLFQFAKAKVEGTGISGCERFIYGLIVRCTSDHLDACAQAPWRCFHCDEVFTDRAAAATHFGTHERHHPGCHIDVAEYRRMEAECEAHRDEDAQIHREMRRQEIDHALALRRAEEQGYARGLQDAYAGQAGRAIGELSNALRELLNPGMTNKRDRWPEVVRARQVLAACDADFFGAAVPSGWRWEIVPSALADMAHALRVKSFDHIGADAVDGELALTVRSTEWWTASRWVSDPTMFHLSGPDNTECDVREDDRSEQGRFLSVLAQFLSVGIRPALRTYQTRVADWLARCFHPSQYRNMVERGDRLLEEVLELLQAHGYDKHRVATLVQYVYGRPVGEPVQEMGGVMVTLAAFATVAGLDMEAAGETELARISQPEVMEKVRIKQKTKNLLHVEEWG